jgi:hypothetical protein
MFAFSVSHRKPTKAFFIRYRLRIRDSASGIILYKFSLLRDCVAITLCYFVEKRGLLKLPTMNFFKNLGVKPFLKISIFYLFPNYDTVSARE